MNITEISNSMMKSVDFFKSTSEKLNTLRMNISLLDDIKIKLPDGQFLSLKSVGSITSLDGLNMRIKLWDSSNAQHVEKAILNENSAFSVSRDDTGDIIVTLPKPSEQRRKDIIKSIHQKSEEAKVSIRNIRRHAIDQEKKEEISKDDIKKNISIIDKQCDHHISLIDAFYKKIQNDVMAI